MLSDSPPERDVIWTDAGVTAAGSDFEMLIDESSLEMLEDLVTAATNDAVNRVQAATQEHMAGLTQGMNLPAGFKLPF